MPEWKEKYFDAELADLCTKLTMKTPDERLGFNGGIEEVKIHPWFAKHVDFDAILSDRAVPTFLPSSDVNASDQDEIGQFDDKGLPKLEAADRDQYKDWDLADPGLYRAEIIDYLEWKKNEVVVKKGGCVIL